MARGRKLTRTERARKILAGAGITREDSDDELGTEDYPWEWIYEDDAEIQGAEHSTRRVRETIPNDRGQQLADNEEDGFDAVDQEEDWKAGQKRKRTMPKKTHARNIVGAKMGSIFKCLLGDTVLLKSPNPGEAYVGLICSFKEKRNGEKSAELMWFDRAKAIEEKAKKRMDYLPNEVYIIPAYDNNPLASINGTAIIMSKERFDREYPKGKIPRSLQGKVFVCRRGCKPGARSAVYTDDFIWEDIYKGTPEDISAMIARVDVLNELRKRKPRTLKANNEDIDAEYSDQQDETSAVPRTPKRRKLTTTASPSKFTTPTHKRINVKRPLEFTPLGTRVISPSALTASPFVLARSRLHVAAVPDSLPCRENEFEVVYSHLSSAILSGSGSCIYISGTPGTGKTATVREVISQLTAAALDNELPDFIFVEINGLKLTDPHYSYSLLWEGLNGARVSPTHALSLLTTEFSHPNPRRVPCVVLMDELDQLVTKNQSVMYNFFNWPALAHSRLIVLAVANTMDLPERTLSNKISSRLGLTRITFPGYTHHQLQTIITKRLENVPGNIVDSDAIQFAARKVAAVSGDARRCLDICRRAVEIAEAEAESDPAGGWPSQEPSTPSKLPPAARRKGHVTIPTIKTAITESTASPLAQYLRTLSVAYKLFLSSLLSLIRRTGIPEHLLADVYSEAHRIAVMVTSNAVVHAIKTYILRTPDLLSGTTNALSKKGKSQLQARDNPRLVGLFEVAVSLTEAGVLVLENGKGERGRRVRLRVAEEEVRSALRGDDEAKGVGVGE